MINLLVNAVRMFDKEWPKDSRVDEMRATVFAGHHQPEEEHTLGQRVERYPEEQMIAKELAQAEHCIHHPVHEPFGVVFDVA